MVRRKSSPQTSSQLILGHLERISVEVFRRYPKQLTDLVAQQHGIYALYKKDRLYYVGLAADLRRRINRHLEDRHAQKWNRFSLYIVRKVDHIRELESLILRIADPTGNAVKGRLPRAENLIALLEASIRSEQDRQLRDLIGPNGRVRRDRNRQLRVTKALRSEPALLPYTRGRRFRIRGFHNGKTYRARVLCTGWIDFDGNRFRTPSGAGRAARKRSTNGWNFWHFKRKREWVPLDRIRTRR
jgi:hypothetical protein